MLIGSDRVSLTFVGFAEGAPPSLLRAAEDYVPVPVDGPAFRSLATGEAFGPQSPIRTPPPPLNPPSDCMVGVPVNPAPVGGRLSLFVAQWQTITRDHFIISVVAQGFQISVQDNFPGVLREVNVSPRDLKAHLAICKEIQELVQKKAIVQIDDFPLLCLSPIFFYSQKDRGSLRYFESEENQRVHFGTTLQNGNPQCYSAESARSRLGSRDRSEGRLPSRAGSPPVQETVGFQIPRQDLRVQDLAFWPKRLSVGLFESSYNRSSPSPAGHPDILLSGRLASGGGVPVTSPVPPSSHSSVVPEFGVHRQLEEISAHPSEDARLSQSAYRHFHSTETALVKVLNDLLLAIDKGLEAVLILLDYSAAFDTLDHVALCHRLETHYGVTGTVLQWIKSYLNGRSQKIIVNGSCSKSFPIPYGVPQGSVIGPLIFILYTGPLGKIINSQHGVQHIVYADDTQIYLILKPTEQAEAMHRLKDCIEDVKKWSVANKLQLNELKTEMLHITSQFRNSNRIPNFELQTGSIQCSESARDLGVLLDDNLALHQHIRNVCRSASWGISKIGKLWKFLNNPACYKM